MTDYFLDTNIVLRHLLGDHKTHSPKANAIFEAIAHGKIVGYVSTLVLHEATYILEKVYLNSRKRIVEYITQLLQLNNLKVIDLDEKFVIEALKDYQQTKVDFPDCVYKQICKSQGLNLMTFDKHFKKLGIATKQTI